MLLLVDNGSLYTDELDKLVSSTHCKKVRKYPSQINLESLNMYTSFVLSGRQTNDKKTNAVNSQIVKYAIKHNLALFGVCYGAEIMALACGGSIRKMAMPRRGLHTIEPTAQNDLCTNEISVFQSHRYEISHLPPTISSIASSTLCANEIIHINDTAVYGTQFHPEMSDDGKVLFDKFVKRHIDPA